MTKIILALILLILSTSIFARAPDFKDVYYGDDVKQTLDIYQPSRKRFDAPLIIMIHGGAWYMGDKANKNVVENKVSGFVDFGGATLISINYRFLTALDELDDVTQAIKFIRDNADQYGLNLNNIVLMGHSAGGHLAALYAVMHPLQINKVVLLDAALFDVVSMMTHQHKSIYDPIFTSDPEAWLRASPLLLIDSTVPQADTMIICSTLRPGSCDMSSTFGERLGAAKLIISPLDHAGVNAELGLPSTYTATVRSFMFK